ncbi:MAG: prephenate dehydrogenase/arogenate dehydrogenase family protein [Bdellovibrionota bacterium]|jgi:prephenate dehydrogenase
MREHFETVGFIGYGKFTKLLISLFTKYMPKATLRVSSRSNESDGVLFFDKPTVCSSELIIPCVPIRNFETTIKEISPLLKSGQTILDVCSVKVHPKEVLLNNITEGVNLIGSHPMFGPASYEKLAGDLRGCCVIIEKIRSQVEPFAIIKGFFTALNLTLVEMTAEEHDKKAAKFQFITLSAATILKKLNIQRESIDTPSALKMLDFLDMISVDADLVLDLYKYNPYCHEEFKRFEDAFEQLRTELYNVA